MFAESIDVILLSGARSALRHRLLPDNRFKVSTARTMTLDLGVGISLPYQTPRPRPSALWWRRSRPAWF
jgi:hypothetical protein